MLMKPNKRKIIVTFLKTGATLNLSCVTSKRANDEGFQLSCWFMTDPQPSVVPNLALDDLCNDSQNQRRVCGLGVEQMWEEIVWMQATLKILWVRGGYGHRYCGCRVGAGRQR